MPSGALFARFCVCSRLCIELRIFLRKVIGAKCIALAGERRQGDSHDRGWSDGFCCRRQGRQTQIERFGSGGDRIQDGRVMPARVSPL